MDILFQILLGILLILSCIGYMQLVRNKLSLSWEFIPLFVFSSIACIIFFGGLINILFEISIAVMLLGLVLFFTGPIFWLRKGKNLDISWSLFHVLFISGTIIFLFLLSKDHLIHYDNFSHWSIVLKLMLSTDSFPTLDSQLIDFKNYPLGVSAFLYYICLFAGNSESIMLIAQGLLIFSCFYAMFGIISEKKRFLLYAFLGLGLSFLSLFNITIRINNLLVDFLLPIYLLAIFSIIYSLRNNLKQICISIIPLLGILMVIKNTGIIFALFGYLYFIYICLTRWRIAINKKIIIAVSVFISALTPYLGWNIRMATIFKGVENKFEVTSTTFQNVSLEKTSEQIYDIVLLFLKSSLDLMSRPTLGIIAFNLFAIVASIFAVAVLKKKWNLWKALIALNTILLVYYLGILGMYIYSMPIEEAIVLAGFERYASSIVIVFIGGLVLCATIDVERSFHYKIGEVPSFKAFKNATNKRYYQRGITVCIAITLILLLSEYNGIYYIAQNYETTLPYKVYSVTGDRWYEKGIEDDSKYLFYSSDENLQVTNYYMQYIGRYFLYAPNVDAIVLFYEDNMDNLLSNYDYLVVIETDLEAKRLLRKHYDVDMIEGIYEIIVAEGKVELSLH